ncbi:ABC transporter permease [Nonomuraea gerenzanensis]|uniref:ABC transporter membrane-spanning protein n=1 Tax=Nonomuraea gerenzanensis TaxID=93944 RepID=A0A1M4E487_9ACTN|nr:polyketide antibiotic transporter [Nonomuraea gerenzanensis]UBU15784.1 polyketide antibiotic transporter [Nonomuraea gerenzanensis]SBO93568.1 ABC transporter membrane-spanning protein [Nonomuraea gerenzanensis]
MTATLGTGTLARLALRREAGLAPWWILLIVAMALAMVAYVNRAMGTYELKLTYLEVIDRSPFLHAIGGGVVEPRLEVLATWRSAGFLYVASAFAALMSVIRHTRREEDAGRSELVLAGRVGRSAPLTAALLVAGGLSLAGGALAAVALIGVGLEPVGSLAYGAGITVAGWMFGGVAAVAAQLARTAHTATVIATTTLGVALTMRFAADASGMLWLKYLSPVGWLHLARPYQDERWWLLGVCALVSAILYGAAYGLLGHRDLGSGLLPERQGRESAPELRGPVSLAWRLHRGLLAKWAAGVAVFAALGGSLSPLARDLISRPSIIVDNITQLLGISTGTRMLGGYVWYLVLILAYAVALHPVLMTLRLRAEETSGRAEALQAAPMTRLRWAAGHLLVTALGTAGLMAVAGLVFGVVYSLLVGDLATDLPSFLAGALSTVPAAWCVGAVCVLAYGLVPRASVVIAWLAWILTAALGQVVGPLYGLWGGSPLEPFHYIGNAMLGPAFQPAPTAALLAVTALLTATGLLALRRRDFGTAG